jgi:hypothetical protein
MNHEHEKPGSYDRKRAETEQSMTTFKSPRLMALQHELVAGNRAALEDFWRETTEQGTPLIEFLSDDKEHMLVTFVWRAAADTTNVVLISELVNGWWWNNFADSTLTRLLDTNLYYRTYRVRGDTRFLYRLAPNHSLIHPVDVVDWDAYRAPMQPDPLNSRRYVFPRNEQDPGSAEQVWSMVEMPGAPPQPYIIRRPGIPAGQMQAHRLRSDILASGYQVWVYTPPGYACLGRPYAVLLLVDGWYYTTLMSASLFGQIAGQFHLAQVLSRMARDDEQDFTAGQHPHRGWISALLARAVTERRRCCRAAGH